MNYTQRLIEKNVTHYCHLQKCTLQQLLFQILIVEFCTTLMEVVTQVNLKFTLRY